MKYVIVIVALAVLSAMAVMLIFGPEAMSDETFAQRVRYLAEENERQRVEITRLKATVDDAIATMTEMTKMVKLAEPLKWMQPALVVMYVALGFLAGRLL